MTGRHLARRIGSRALAGVWVLWGAATLSFIALHLTAGDAALATVAGQGANPSKEILDAVRRDFGLDQPLHEQYLGYLNRLLHGDLGRSYQQRIDVSQAIAQQIGPTVELAIAAAVVAVVLAIAVALLTAGRRPWRSIASGSELILSATPTFVVGIVLLIIFSFTLNLLPVSGSEGPLSLILPTFTLALPIGAVLTQVLRSELEEVLEQPFILTARTRGMRDAGVRLRHALRPALVQIVTMSGFVVGGLLGGAVITETLFVRQGVGQLMLAAVTAKDTPMVVGLVIFAALIYVTVNLIVDIGYTVIDPRLVAR